MKEEEAKELDALLADNERRNQERVRETHQREFTEYCSLGRSTFEVTV